MIQLIADENISWRLKKLLPNWEILPSNELKIDDRLTDLKIWQFARIKGYAILTFDEDFCELQNLYSYLPKIVWLRTGNVNTQTIANLLSSLQEDISKFLSTDDLGIYEIYL